jgi:hypothetical protein
MMTKKLNAVRLDPELEKSIDEYRRRRIREGAAGYSKSDVIRDALAIGLVTLKRIHSEAEEMRSDGQITIRIA